MPNWCEGYLRVRGPVNNIRKFFENAFEIVTNESRDINDLISLMPYDNEFEVYVEDIVWLKHTRRGFVEACNTYVHPNNDGVGCAVISYKQAWAADAEQLLEVAKEFEVDLRFFGGEQGMCFTQTIEIVDGEITVNEAKEYSGDSWDWESPVPKWGG